MVFAQQHFMKIGVALYDLAYPRYCQYKILRAAILENGNMFSQLQFFIPEHSLNKMILLIGHNIKVRRGLLDGIRTAIFNENCGLGAAIFLFICHFYNI